MVSKTSVLYNVVGSIKACCFFFALPLEIVVDTGGKQACFMCSYRSCCIHPFCWVSQSQLSFAFSLHPGVLSLVIAYSRAELMLSNLESFTNHPNNADSPWTYLLKL